MSSVTRSRPETSVLAFSRGRLATNLPLLPCRLQLPIPVGVDLLLTPGEHVLRRDRRQEFALHPESNGKIERWHKSLKGVCITQAAQPAGTSEIASIT
jgi:hypothetical protein